MRILLINQHFFPEVASSGQIMTELCADMARDGHTVTVLTGVPSYRPKEQQESADTRPGILSDDEWQIIAGKFLTFLRKFLHSKIFDLDSVFGIYIIRTYVYSPHLREDKWRYIQRLLQYLTFFINSLIIAMFLPRQDVVIYLSTPPLLNGLTAYALKLIKGTVNIYNIQDLYPDVAIKLGVLNNKWIISACNFVESFLYRHAAAIVPVGDMMVRVLLQKGADPNKIEVIPNWTDSEFMRPLGKDTAFSRQHGFVNRFVVMYSGNMGLSQGLEVVLRCAEITKKENILYILAGGGASRQALIEMAESMKLPNVRFLSYQPRERLPESLSAADIHLITLKKGLSSYSVPSKVYGILASGKPLIASVDEDSEIAFITQQAECGIVVKPEDAHALAEAIIKLYHEPHILVKMGKNGRAYLEKTNIRSVCSRRYMNLINRVA